MSMLAYTTIDELDFKKMRGYFTQHLKYVPLNKFCTYDEELSLINVLPSINHVNRIWEIFIPSPLYGPFS